MPRPTTAQLAYGSLTVVLSTFAMLLLSDARSGTGVAVCCAAGLVLGLLVAVTVTLPAVARVKSAQAPDPSAAPAPVPEHLATRPAARRPLPRAAGGRGVREAREATLRR
ncbi:MMPL family transporter [Actinacidiphila alni]|uniref:MMPL family transporter n=1 Tax=Actinacidiphila alni TaxID=380248 RepID=UPI0033E90F07